MIKILTTCEIAELHIDIPCMDFKLDKVRWIKVEDVEENELIIFKEKVKDYADFVDKNIGWEYGFSMDEYREKRKRLGL